MLPIEDLKIYIQNKEKINEYLENVSKRIIKNCNKGLYSLLIIENKFEEIQYIITNIISILGYNIEILNNTSFKISWEDKLSTSEFIGIDFISCYTAKNLSDKFYDDIKIFNKHINKIQKLIIDKINNNIEEDNFNLYIDLKNIGIDSNLKNKIISELFDKGNYFVNEVNIDGQDKLVINLK